MRTSDCRMDRYIEDRLSVFVDRLREGQVEEINCSCPPEFLSLEEKELRPCSEISVFGSAQVIDQQLLLQLTATVLIEMPCSVCNELCQTEVRVEDFALTESCDQIRAGIYRYANNLREAILLEIPQFAECSEGHCPSRAEIANYTASHSPQETGQNPFANL